jgi:hypothetical protein
MNSRGIKCTHDLVICIDSKRRDGSVLIPFHDINPICGEFKAMDQNTKPQIDSRVGEVVVAPYIPFFFIYGKRRYPSVSAPPSTEKSIFIDTFQGTFSISLGFDFPLTVVRIQVVHR